MQGNSLLRGPKDVVSNILSGISPSLAANATAKPLVPCSVPHTMAFQIGGKMFPVDPRDFISSVDSKNTQDCVASSMVSGDAPSKGALFSWSLGDPFLKSCVSCQLSIYASCNESTETSSPFTMAT